MSAIFTSSYGKRFSFSQRSHSVNIYNIQFSKHCDCIVCSLTMAMDSGLWTQHPTHTHIHITHVNGGWVPTSVITEDRPPPRVVNVRDFLGLKIGFVSKYLIRCNWNLFIELLLVNVFEVGTSTFLECRPATCMTL